MATLACLGSALPCCRSAAADLTTDDPADIVAAIARFDETGAPVVSVTPTHPVAWHQTLDESGVIVGHPPDEPSLVLSGAFYVIGPDALQSAGRFVISGRTGAFVVPADRSIDVDEEADLQVADALARARPRTLSIAIDPSAQAAAS